MKGHYKPTMDQMIKFLCGEEALLGFWFGDRPVGEPQYWWRKHLRDAALPAEADQRDAALEEALRELSLFANKCTASRGDQHYLHGLWKAQEIVTALTDRIENKNQVNLER